MISKPHKYNRANTGARDLLKHGITGSVGVRYSSSMERVTVLSVVTHETDTVECFVRHHASSAKRIVLIACNPDAAMLGILNGLKAEGLPLMIVRDNGTGGGGAGTLTPPKPNP